MNLDEARAQIDQIDKEMVSLFEQRMNAVLNVARYKKEHGMVVFDPARESAVLDRVRESVSPALADYAVSLWESLMELAKSLERSIIASDSPGVQAIRDLAANAGSPIPHPRVAVQGVAGAYAHLAAKHMYPDGDISFCERWADVFYALQDGLCDYGILPVENSSAGAVAEVYDLMRQFKFYIVKAYPLPVKHCLLGVRGATLRDIRHVYTIPIAYMQCADFFKQHRHIQQVPVANTAIAAQQVARLGDKTCAALCSRECAQLYGLDVLAEHIQQTSTNCTRFISISRHLEIPPNANKISLLFTLPHVTGSLHRTLARFAHGGLNLTKIESRPNPDKNFEYVFYLDFTGTLAAPSTAELLGNLWDELVVFHFLGNYYEPKA
ncbi:bifunctional chorismate mutase/prephenate dehydratase [Ethanoligenens harbinense]|uniref:Bifunctional chorismate mutase/prephenate dehydratase n=1 Tax=Ethanoligenens harbinense (strain DSM 18485 / JCM 12961 / CGMCC 1.5033 / YUAN-3) TaxID=663278 RepID=E6U7N1_ETHHY|nr:bifunctional chorismate mutase/prephenate dehydratase [Ethanoligenens harbinense]ADU28154.1 chorismate mutase [Ethanoligenens harbinense YUAN-3]